MDFSGNKLLGPPGGRSRHSKNAKMQKIEKFMAKSVKSFEKMMPSAFTGAVKSAVVSLGWQGDGAPQQQQQQLKVEEKVKPTVNRMKSKSKGSNQKYKRSDRKGTKPKGKAKEVHPHRSVEYRLSRTVVAALTHTPMLRSISLAQCGLNNLFCRELVECIRSQQKVQAGEANSTDSSCSIDVSLNGISAESLEDVAQSSKLLSALRKSGAQI